MEEDSTVSAMLQLGRDTSPNEDGDNAKEMKESDLIGMETNSQNNGKEDEMERNENGNDLVAIDTISNEREPNGNDLVSTSDGDEQPEEPKPGMVFSSEKAVYLYYLDYSQKKGFVMMRRTSKPGIDGKVKYFTLACARGGKNRSNAKSPFSRKPSTKTECNAKIRAAVCPDGSFILTTVKVEHNHMLSPEAVQYPKCKKKSLPYVKRRLEKDQVRVITNKVRTGPLKLEVGDGEAICKYFARMQCRDSSFFNMVDIDDECRVRNLFWADGRSRAAYEAFGDVVTLDTRYLTDGYDMPLVIFIGVNHHGQQILLGCALLSNEDTKTWLWLFETWLDCMSRCPPKAIITGQGRAIQAAVERVFPNTRHRLCLWDIMTKLPEKLSSCSQHDAIKIALQNKIYDSATLSEFEEGWRETIDQYGLYNNQWLVDLYGERHLWAPVYIRESFWAGMSIAHRDGSMRPFFDGCVSFETSLKQFVDQYDYILRCKLEKENQADHTSSNSRYECVTHYDIEKQFQEAYTNTKFKEFQDELKGKIYCYPSLVEEQGLVSTYKVSEDVKVGDKWKDVFWNVSFNQKEIEVHCTCCLFEFRGILCRHALAVLTQRKVREVPPKYILLRWKKDLMRKHNFVRNSYDDWSRPTPDILRYDKLCKEFSEIAAISAGSNEKCNILTSFIYEFKDKVLNYKPPILCQGNQQTCDPSVAYPDINGMSRGGLTSTNSPSLGSRSRPPRKRKVSKINQGANLNGLIGCSYGGLEISHSSLSASQPQEVRCESQLDTNSSN